MEIVTQQQSLQQHQQHPQHHSLGHPQSGSSQRHVGLLQIAPMNSGRGSSLTNTTLTASSSSMGGMTAVSSSIIMSAVSSSAAPTLGIPTPNLTGVLTGIKPPPLFSLPGARGAEPGGGAFRHQQDKPEEEKPVSYVLGGYRYLSTW
jgi:hypothetical protein